MIQLRCKMLRDLKIEVQNEEKTQTRRKNLELSHPYVGVCRSRDDLLGNSDQKARG